ncbi:MAG: hypothetical protein V4812_00690 [Pseudomonadota bacterium]
MPDEAFIYCDHSEAIRLKHLLNLLRQPATLTGVEHEQDVIAQIDEITQRLEEFTALIESNDWFLINQKKQLLGYYPRSFIQTVQLHGAYESKAHEPIKSREYTSAKSPSAWALPSPMAERIEVRQIDN